NHTLDIVVTIEQAEDALHRSVGKSCSGVKQKEDNENSVELGRVVKINELQDLKTGLTIIMKSFVNRERAILDRRRKKKQEEEEQISKGRGQWDPRATPLSAKKSRIRECGKRSKKEKEIPPNIVRCQVDQLS
ncbi:hypothetical protein JTB14_005742, partial [Gonioctena quinquepunctata]